MTMDIFNCIKNKIKLNRNREIYVYSDPSYGSSLVKDGGDCMARSLTNALDISYNNAFDLLSVQGWHEETKYDYLVMEETLKAYGIDFELRFVYDYDTMIELVSDKLYSKGTFIVCGDNHAMCVKDGIIYDSFDSRMYQPYIVFCISGYSKKKEIKSTKIKTFSKDKFRNGQVVWCNKHNNYIELVELLTEVDGKWELVPDCCV